MLFSFICAVMSFLPQDLAFGTKAWNHQLFLNFLSVGVLFGAGAIMPIMSWFEKRKEESA